MIVLVVVVLTACGRPNKVPTTGGGAEPIVIGTVGTTSGQLGSRYGVMQHAVEAWADEVNANGGITGRPVRVEVADDENDPRRHLDLVQEMVEERDVLALVGVPATQTQSASVGYLEEKGIPVIGGNIGEAPWGASPILFPQGISEVTKSRALLYVAASTGKAKYAFIYADSHGHASMVDVDDDIEALRAGADEAEIDLVLVEAIQAGASTYDEVCLHAKSAGAEMMTITADFATQANVIESCARQDFHPTYVTTGTTTRQELVDLVGDEMEGAVGLSRTAPWMADSPADLAVWRTAMDANGLEVGGTALLGWVSGRIAEAAMRQVEGDISPASITKELRGLEGNNLNGLIGPIDFGQSPADPNPGSSCFWSLVVEDGAWTPSEVGQLCLRQ